MIDRLMAILALVVLGIFLWILAYKVPRLDLSLVIGTTFLLAVYDFLISPARAGRR